MNILVEYIRFNWTVHDTGSYKVQHIIFTLNTQTVTCLSAAGFVSLCVKVSKSSLVKNGFQEKDYLL